MKVQQAKVYLHLRALYIHQVTLALLSIGNLNFFPLKVGHRNVMSSSLSYWLLGGPQVGLSRNDKQRRKQFSFEDFISQCCEGFAATQNRAVYLGPRSPGPKKGDISWWGRGRQGWGLRQQLQLSSIDLIVSLVNTLQRLIPQSAALPPCLYLMPSICLENSCCTNSW